MRLLFVHPGPLLYTKVFLRLEPLGLEIVAEAARSAGHAVKLIDLQVESHARLPSHARGLAAGLCRVFMQLPREHPRSYRSREKNQAGAAAQLRLCGRP